MGFNSGLKGLISTVGRMSDQIHPKAVLPHEKEHLVTYGKRTI